MNTKIFLQKAKFKLLQYFNTPIYYLYFFKIKLILSRSDEIYLIYSIGKVGSSSVYYSLKKIKSKNIFHIHFLNNNNIKKQIQYYKNSSRKSVPLHLIKSKILSRLIDHYQGTLNIITLTREPISRELSSIFQDALIFKNFYQNGKANNKIIDKVLTDKIQKFRNGLPEENWFKSELDNVFKIDIAKLDFDAKKGYTNYKKNNINFVLIRLEDLNKVFKKAIYDSFKIENIDLLMENDSKDKFYKNAYAKFKNDINIDLEIIYSIIESEYYQKFYPDFTNKAISKWIKN